MKINLKNTILALAAFAMVGGVTAAGVTAFGNNAVETKATEQVYRTALFGASYNSKGVSSYTDTWTSTNSGFTVSVENGNNYNNGWDYIKFGRKKTASVGSVSTSAAIDKAVTKVAVTIDALTASSINSIKLYTSSNGSSWTENSSFSKEIGNEEVQLSSPTENLYYKVEFDCASGSSNGLITVSKIEYYCDITSEESSAASSEESSATSSEESSVASAEQSSEAISSEQSPATKNVVIVDKTDTLNLELTGVTGTSYADWSGVSDSSSAVYAGQSAAGNDSIQLRSKNSNSGIITTTSGGDALKVVVKWNSNTTNGNKIDIYGKNSAYASPTELYGSSSTQGTKIDSIVKGTSTSLTINDSYPYIGIRSYSGAVYLDEITIEWGAHCESTDVAAVDQFINGYMHLDAVVDSEGMTGTDACKGWYGEAKSHFASLTTAQKDIILKSESVYGTVSEKEWKYVQVSDRLADWAKANSDVFNQEDGTFLKAGNVSFQTNSSDSGLPLVITLIAFGGLAAGGMILLSKKRKRA